MIHNRISGFQRALTALILFSIILSACIPAAPTSEPKGGGGDFRVALASDPQSLNPNLRSDDWAYVVGQNVYNKLVTLDANYQIIPDLAESWKISDDGLVYTFQLAKNVTWHDGKPFSSADVKFTFEAIAKGGLRADAAGKISSIETPDANTVIIHLKEAWSPFLPTIAWYAAFILPEHVFAGSDWTKNPANDTPVGTGPFKFAEWVKGDHIRLTANLNYFRRGPYLDNLTFLILKDPNSGPDLLTGGKIDYLYASPTSRQKIVDLQGVKGVKVSTFAHPGRYYIGFNLRRAPFSDQRLRLAINTAIDRKALVDQALLGYGSPGLGFYTPSIAWAYNPKAQAPAFDLAAATALLDQMGLPPDGEGIRLKANLVTYNLSPFMDLAKVVQTQLKAAGIAVEVVLVKSADYTQRVGKDNDFDMALTNGTWGPDPDSLNTRFGAKGTGNFEGYNNPDFEAAVAEGGRLVKASERAGAYF
jgi:peptide/nickel transport system substrate-binding protein